MQEEEKDLKQLCYIYTYIKKYRKIDCCATHILDYYYNCFHIYTTQQRIPPIFLHLQIQYTNTYNIYFMLMFKYIYVLLYVSDQLTWNII